MNPQDFWFPWYPQLYADHAIGLNLEQDAIYRRLIDRYMLMREPLPSNSQAIANICMISLDKWLEHSKEILVFFKERVWLLHHKKCDIELNRQDNRSKKMSDNAKKSAEKRKQKQKVASGGLATATIQDKTGQDRTGEKENNPLLFPPPKGEKNAKRARKQKPVEFITEDFGPDIGQLSLAGELGLDADAERRRFVDHWLAKGEARADWQASFRTWLRNSAKFRDERKQGNLAGRSHVTDVTGAALRVAARGEKIN